MPTSTHEYIIARVVSEIEKQLETITGTAEIKHLGSPRLELVVEDSDDEDGGGDAVHKVVTGIILERAAPSLRMTSTSLMQHLEITKTNILV